MSQTPTSRTLSYCRELGWVVDIAEHWNSFAHIRVDLFGFIDVIALTGTEILAIQCTNYANVSKRVNKINNECRDNAIAFVRSGGRIEVWGWKRRKTRGDNGRYWQVRRVPVLMDEPICGE